MDTKVNYTLVGVFVFSFGLGLVLFLLWMAKYGFEEPDFNHYTILVAESVSGLNIESPVKFRGVEVGRVDAINIDSENSEIVKVLIAVKPNTPIKQDSVAVLTAQGITGLSYLELKGGSKKSPRLAPGGVIQAGQSLFNKLENSATNVGDGIVFTLKRVDALLSEKNILAIETLLTNLSILSNSLTVLVEQRLPLIINSENAGNLEGVLENLETITRQVQAQLPLILSDENVANIAKTLSSVASIGKNIEPESKKMRQLVKTTLELEKIAATTFQDYSELSVALNKLSASVQQRIDSGEYDLRQMTEHHLETLNALLIEMQILSNTTNELLQQLKRSPSDILFKQEIIKPGPGE